MSEQSQDPPYIWLQTAGEKATDKWGDPHEGVTWCSNPINDGDQKYMRFNLVEAAIELAIIEAAEKFSGTEYVHIDLYNKLVDKFETYIVSKNHAVFFPQNKGESR